MLLKARIQILTLYVYARGQGVFSARTDKNAYCTIGELRAFSADILDLQNVKIYSNFLKTQQIKHI